MEKDKSVNVLRYLLTIHGPAYTCRTYWDWIEQLIEHHFIKKLTDSNQAVYDVRKKSLFELILANIFKYHEGQGTEPANVCGRRRPVILYDLSGPAINKFWAIGLSSLLISL